MDEDASSSVVVPKLLKSHLRQESSPQKNKEQSSPQKNKEQEVGGRGEERAAESKEDDSSKSKEDDSSKNKEDKSSKNKEDKSSSTDGTGRIKTECRCGAKACRKFVFE